MRHRKWATIIAFMLVSTSAVVFASTRYQESVGEQLLQAVRQHRIDLVRQLVKGGTDVDAGLPGNGTALIVAAKHGDLAMVNALLDLGADANHSLHGDGNPLIAASATGNLAVMARLLAAGARIDAVVPDDETALISAVRNDRPKAVEFLVEQGADVNLGVVANGVEWRSPLNQARSEAVRNYLVGAGAVVGHPK